MMFFTTQMEGFVTSEPNNLKRECKSTADDGKKSTILRRKLQWLTALLNSGVACPKFWGGQNVWFRRATAFCLGRRFSKQKMTRYAKIWGMGLGGKFLVVQRIFAQISPKNSKKTTAFHYIFGTFLSKQSASGTIFAKFSLTCPQKPKKRPPKKRKNVCTFWFCLKSVRINRFCECFHTFCTNFHSFSPDFAKIFTKSKLLGVRLHPRLLHQWFWGLAL